MKKTLVLVFVLLITILYGAQITSISPIFQDGQVTFRIDTDVNLSKDNVFVEKNAAGSLVSIHLKNVNLSSSPFFLPVAYGPVDSLRAIGTYQGSLVLFQLLIPKEPLIEFDGKTLKVTFKGSEKHIDLALTEGSNLETAVKFLAEELNLNVVLSDTVKAAKLALKLSNITPEEALRNILLTIRVGTEPMAYSYMPDGTLHIGTKKEISQRFAQFWGIYEASEDIVQKIEKILSPTTVMTYLPNKALLFIYGDIYEQELISKILSVTPPSVTREITVSAPVEDVSKLLNSLKNVYTFQFNLLEGLDKFIITGDSKTVQTVVNYVSQLEERFRKSQTETSSVEQTKTQPQVQSKQIKVIYPKEACDVLKAIGIDAVQLPFGVLELKGSQIQLEIAQGVLNDLGFTGTAEVELLDIPKQIQQKVLSALSVVFDVPSSRFVDLQEGLFVIAPSEIRKGIKNIASELTRFYYTLRQSEVFFLNDEQTAAQISQILNQIYGIESVTVQNILKITGSEEDLNKARTFLRTFVKDRFIRTVNVSFSDETYNEVKTLIEKTLDVKVEANLKSLGVVLISSYNQDDLQKAVEELQKIYSSITPVAAQKIVKIVPLVEKFNFEDAKLSLSKLYEVDLEKTDLFYIMTGEEEKIQEAEKFLERIRNYLHKEETYTIVQVPEGFEAKDISDILSKLTQINIYTANRMMILHGEKQAIEKAQDFLNQIQVVVSKIKPEEPKTESIVRILEYREDIPDDEFKSFLQSINNNTKFDAFPKLGVVVFSGTSLDVQKAVEEYEKFSEKIKQKAEAQKVESQPIQIKRNPDETVSIKCDNKPLKELISKVVEELGVSFVFVNTPDENVTMNISSINWEDFKKFIEEQYGYSFIETKDITALVKPKPVADTTPQQKFVYTLPHNLDRVKSLVEFYGGKVYVDDLKNLIVITGLSKENIQQIESLMQDISKPMKQVEIEARLVDRSLIDSLERSFSFSISLPGIVNPEISLSDSELNITTSVINMFDYQRLLSFLKDASVTVSSKINDSNNLNNILASPRIVTSSGKEARILIGDRIPYQTVDQNGNVSVNFLDTGIELKITPYVQNDGTIELNVFTKVSKATYYPNISIPGESTREAQTQVTIKNGDTLVIGGLIRETNEQTDSKIPVLGDLPFIGQLFRTKTEQKDKRELIIFITAKVIE